MDPMDIEDEQQPRRHATIAAVSNTSSTHNVSPVPVPPTSAQTTPPAAAPSSPRRQSQPLLAAVTDSDNDTITALVTSPSSSTGGHNNSRDLEEARRRSSQAHQQQESLSQRYIRQMLYGCGRPTCANPHCASNPLFSAVTTQEIAALSATLARLGPVHLCPGVGESLTTSPISPSVPPQDGVGSESAVLQLDVLSRVVAQARESDNWAGLMRRLYACFSSLAPLSQSFSSSVDTAHSIPDAKQAHAAFRLLTSKCPPAMLSCVFTATACLFDKLAVKQEEINSEQDLAAFVVLLTNPYLLDSTYHTTIVQRLCESIAQLDEPMREQLGHLLVRARLPQIAGTLPPEDVRRLLCREQKLRDTTCIPDFRGMVAVFQHFITMHVYSLVAPTGATTTLNSDRSLAYATQCLALLYSVNEFYQFIPFEDFYNDTVNEHLEIKEDFPLWKAKEGFSFCNYPFILTPVIKSDILKVESMVQMRHELQDAFFRAMFIGVNSPYLVLDIRRDHIIRDALYQLESKKPQDLKKQLKVQFVGEEGVDEGGIQKEFFQLVVREMFDGKYDIFQLNEESQLYWFVYSPLLDEAGLVELKLVGRLIGLAIYNGVIMDIHFPLALYKKLMMLPVGLDDLEALDPLLAKNLRTLLTFDGDVEETFGRRFQIDMPVVGSIHTVDLKPDGASIPLTNDNRQEFVQLYVDFILNTGIDRQFRAFRDGFESVCMNSAISLFRPEEVELLVCGSSDLDFEALRAVTHYDGGFTAETPVIQFFWKTVLTVLTDEQKKRLLFFATGTDRVPIGGLSKMTFVIAKNGPDSDRLPSSHTCFNVLLLPEYTQEQKLRDRLLTAIQNAEGFGMI